MTPPYFSIRRLALATVALMPMLLTGCTGSSQEAPAPGRVAVVDMEMLAQASGFAQRLGQIMQQIQQEEQTRLSALQNELGIVPNAPLPTDAQQAQKMGEAQLRMSQAVEQAQQRITMTRYNELDQFRNAVRPIAQRVAYAQGCSIVMERREDMLSVDPSSDITDLVIAELPTSGPQAGGPSNSSSPNIPSQPLPGNAWPGLPPGGGLVPPAQPSQPPAQP